MFGEEDEHGRVRVGMVKRALVNNAEAEFKQPLFVSGLKGRNIWRGDEHGRLLTNAETDLKRPLLFRLPAVAAAPLPALLPPLVPPPLPLPARLLMCDTTFSRSTENASSCIHAWILARVDGEGGGWGCSMRSGLG